MPSRCCAPRTISGLRSSTPPILRKRPQRRAAREGLCRSPRSRRLRNEVRLRFFAPRASPARSESNCRRISRRRSCASALEASLRRLQTEYVDIYQMHNARMAQIDDDALWELLESFKREGKIRMYGVALGPAIGWLYEGIEAVKAQRRDAADHLEHARAVPRQRTDSRRRRGVGRHGIHDPRSALSGMLEGHYTRGDDLPEERSSPSPAARMARQRDPKDRAAAISRTARPHARTSRHRRLLAEPRVMTVLPKSTTRDSSPSSPAPPTHRRSRPTNSRGSTRSIGETSASKSRPMAFKGTMSRGDAQPALSAVEG